MTKIFLDTSNIEEMKKWSHIIDGVTTNPSILAKEGGNIQEICEYISPLPISVEAGGDYYYEAKDLWEWLFPLNPNLAIKIPFLKPNGRDNLVVIDSLIKEGLTINCTAVMSFNQAILADRLGCRYISIFGGRIDDEGGDSIELLRRVEDLVCTNNIFEDSRGSGIYKVSIIVGSIRSSKDVDRYLSLLGTSPCSILTIPPPVLEKMTQHARSQSTSAEFEKDYIGVATLKGINNTQVEMIPHPRPD